MAISIAYRYAIRRELVPAFGDYLHERPLDFDEGRVDRRAPWIDNDVPMRRESGPVHSKSLAETTLDAVSDDGSAERSRGCDAQARALHRVTLNRATLSRAFGAGARNRVTWNRAAGAVGGCAGETECREQRIRDAQALVIDGSKIGGAQNPRRFRKRERGPRCAAGGGISWLWQSVLLFRR